MGLGKDLGSYLSMNGRKKMKKKDLSRFFIMETGLLILPSASQQFFFFFLFLLSQNELL